MLKNFYVVLLLTLLPTLFCQTENLQDVVYLENGSVIRGVIIEQIPNKSIKIKTYDGSIFFHKMSEVTKITKEENLITKRFNDYYNDDDYYYNQKSPELAFLFSFLFIGGGQFYNGEIGKGLIMDALAISGWIMILNGYEVYENNDLDIVYEKRQNEICTIGWFALGGAALWSWIDAPISAQRINEKKRRERRKNTKKFGHLFEYNHGKNTLGVDFSKNKNFNGGKLSFTYHF